MIKVNGREIEFKTFPNGETQLMHKTILKAIENPNPELYEVIFNHEVGFKYENDGDLIKLMFVKKYLDDYFGEGNAMVITLNIQYMMYSRMDRSENDSPFTLNYVAEFINDLQFDNIIVNEPHSDVTCELLDWSEEKFITPILVREAMLEYGFDETDSLMFPDAGAKTRYENLISAGHIIVGEKKRDFETGRITDLKLVGDLEGEGHQVLICDDLSSYGGTFVRSAKELRKQGFDWVGLVVTHAENVIFDGELFDHIDMLFTTDSILDIEGKTIAPKFKEKLTLYKMEELSQ